MGDTAIADVASVIQTLNASFLAFVQASIIEPGTDAPSRGGGTGGKGPDDAEGEAKASPLTWFQAASEEEAGAGRKRGLTAGGSKGSC